MVGRNGPAGARGKPVGGRNSPAGEKLPQHSLPQHLFFALLQQLEQRGEECSRD